MVLKETKQEQGKMSSKQQQNETGHLQPRSPNRLALLG